MTEFKLGTTPFNIKIRTLDSIPSKSLICLLQESFSYLFNLSIQVAFTANCLFLLNFFSSSCQFKATLNKREHRVKKLSLIEYVDFGKHEVLNTVKC